MDHLIAAKTSAIETAYSLLERNIVEKREGYRGPKAAHWSWVEEMSLI